MSKTKHDLDVVVKAHDKATGTLARVAAKLRELNIIDKETRKPKPPPSLVGAFKQVGSAGAMLGREVVGLGAKLGGLLALGGAASFGGLIHGAVTAGAELSRMSARVGTTASWYAKLAKTAELSAVPVTSFNIAMSTLSRSIGEAKAGKGAAYLFLQNVSPALARQFRAAKSTAEGFDLITKAIHKLPDRERQLALSTKVMGEGALDMSVLMAKGTEAIHRQMEEVGALIGEQDVFADKADKMGQSLIKTRLAFEGLRDAAMFELFPALEGLSLSVRRFLTDNRDGLRRWAESTGKAVTEWLQGGGLQRLADGLLTVGRAASWIFNAIGPLGVAIGAAAPLWSPLVPVAWELAAGVGAMMTAIGLPVAPILLATAAIAAMWANWDKLKDLPILRDLERLRQMTIKVKDAVLDLRKVTEVAPEPQEGQLESTRAENEKAAQKRALLTVGKGALEGLGAAFGTLVPAAGLVHLGAEVTHVGDMLSPLGSWIDSLGAGATGAVPLAAQAGYTEQAPAKAEVLVSFGGAPAGMRASVAPGATADVEVSVGPTMSGP